MENSMSMLLAAITASLLTIFVPAAIGFVVAKRLDRKRAASETH
jgi:positive regulator of sigma E activity